ncbi:MAG: Probable Co/Zn/Cd efflux system membrane fusion protein [uncultured Thiotrichaceae bacterium]|uniref:Probable Co/Zn/Cd efflux system membrane fusion protein n=1 Tax=uncultured Thiotrichaceae bacterium TaxID=298394 RepID=A0A6S6S5W5_9GAMM|nr:MAG: Probable Co/Zn/Cd efflux system membrane fusion protein [uncultured Thiotrichaceae bacterium]
MKQFSFILLISLSLSACNEVETVEKPIRPAQTWTVNSELLPERTVYSGDIHARHEVDLAFRVNGKVISRKVEVGDYVEQGQVLAELEKDDLNLNINSAQANLQAAKSEMNNTKSELKRTQDLFNKQFISQAILDTANNRYRTAKSQVKAANAQLTLVKNQAQYSELKAVTSGIVTKTDLEIGQVVSIGQAVIHIAQKGGYESHIQVGEQAIKSMKEDMPVKVALWIDDEEWFDGKIREISPAATSNRTWLVKVTLINPPEGLKLGMTSKVGLQNNVNKMLSWLPATALYQQNNKPAVWLVEDDNHVSLHPVKLEKHLMNGVLVAGLENGTKVIAAGVNRVHDGQEVKPIPYTGRSVPMRSKAQ